MRTPLLSLSFAALAACNDHPLLPLEASLSGGMRETVEYPRVSNVDFLFVVDDSGSMAEEQANLAHNFEALAGLFATGLGGRANVRVAVTDTDLQRADRRGAFVTPDDPDCAGVPSVLSLGVGSALEGAPEAEVSRALRCLTTLGTRGSNREKGLEAMRLALSCDGPNAARFGACCVPGDDGRPVYDRNCTASPDFLRPDATLVVVFLTDEDDCSDPAENPARSTRAICRTGRPEADDCEAGESAEACRARRCDISAQPVRAICRHGAGDLDAAGVPSAYGDAEYCPSGDRAACFATECRGRTAADCHAHFCGGPGAPPVDPAENLKLSTCQWFPGVLTPVDDYRRFLADLKRDPANRLIVAAFTGTPRHTEAGAPVAFGLPVAPTDPACEGAGGLDEPSEACCPGGRCEGEPLSACTSDFGDAAAGLRYLALAEAFGDRGLGCHDPEQCVSLCGGDLAGPLGRLFRVLEEALTVECLTAPALEDTVNVRLECPDGACAPTMLPDTAWAVEPDPACASGQSLHLAAPPPLGARLVLSYGLDLGRSVQP